jgi:hypothetical protein
VIELSATNLGRCCYDGQKPGPLENKILSCVSPAGSPTTPGWAGTRADAPVHVAFRDFDHVGTRDYLAFAAPWLAYALPYRRFADILAGANARLGADADRYSFTVVDLHLLLFAGFDRRTGNQDLCSMTRTSAAFSCNSLGHFSGP